MIGDRAQPPARSALAIVLLAAVVGAVAGWLFAPAAMLMAAPTLALTLALIAGWMPGEAHDRPVADARHPLAAAPCERTRARRRRARERAQAGRADRHLLLARQPPAAAARPSCLTPAASRRPTVAVTHTAHSSPATPADGRRRRSATGAPIPGR